MECCSFKQFPPYISSPLVRRRPPPPSIVSFSGRSYINHLHLSSPTPIFTEVHLFSRHCSRVSASTASNYPRSSRIFPKGFFPNGLFYGRLENGRLPVQKLIVDFLLFPRYPYSIMRWCCNGLLHLIYFLIYYHFCRKRIIHSFPYKMFLFAICLVWCFLSSIIFWDMKRKSERVITDNSPISLTTVASFHTIGIMAKTVSLLELAISFSRATNGVEPILAILLSVILLGEYLSVVVSMLLTFGSCAIAAGTGLNFTLQGFCAAIIANVIFTLRDVHLEGGMKAVILNEKGKSKWADYYGWLLVLSLLIISPIALTMEEMSFIKEFGMKVLGGVLWFHKAKSLFIQLVNVVGALLCILGISMFFKDAANVKGRDAVMNTHSRLSNGTTEKKNVHNMDKEVFKFSFGPDGVIRAPSGNVSGTVSPLSDDEDSCDEGEDKDTGKISCSLFPELQEDNLSLFFKDKKMKITQLIGKTSHTERRIEEVVEPSGKSVAESKDKTNENKAEAVAKWLGPLCVFWISRVQTKALFDQAKIEAPGELYRGIVKVVISLIKVVATFVLKWFPSSGGDSTGPGANDREDQ